jgi:alkylated DNA nucleotide flippase Atl1
VCALIHQVPEGRLTTARAIAHELNTSAISIGRTINWYLDNIVDKKTPVFKVVKMNPLSGKLMPHNVYHRAECARHGFTYDRKGYFLGQDLFFNEFDMELMQTVVENVDDF